MIYFATCGRGFDNFVELELQKLNQVKDILHVAEGKQLFSVCFCSNIESCVRKHNLCDLTDNIEKTFCQNFDLESENFISSEFELLLKLNLVEKIYLLLFYKPIRSGEDSVENIKVSDILAMIEEINFLNCLKIATQLDKIKRRKSLWKMCIDQTVCPASCARQIEKQQRWKRNLESNGTKNKKANIKSSKSCCDEPVDIDRIQSLYSQTSFSTIKKEDHYVNVMESEIQPSYRVSCRIRGMWKKNYQPNILTQSILANLHQKRIGKLDPNNPSLDIYVNLNDDHILIGASLSSKPLSLRPYIPHITLRSTVCNLLTQLTDVKIGESLLDPMCGAGTILLEAAMNIKYIRVLACDENANQLKVAQCNLRGVGNAEFILANASNIPLKEESVDGVVCDFPFGKKHRLIKSFEELLIEVLKESIRVVKTNGRIVFLLSKVQCSFIEKLISEKDFITECNFCLVAQYPISLGLTPAFICVFCKRVRDPY